MVVLLAVLLMLSAFFSGSETALFSLSRVAIARLEGRGAHRLGRLMAKPFRVLTTLLVGNMLVNVAASSVATAVALDVLGNKGMVVSFVAMTILILLFGEILPKTLALSKAETVAPRVARMVDGFGTILFPARWAMEVLSEAVVRVAKRWLPPPRPPVTRGELEEAIELGHTGGTLHGLEREILANILDFGRTSVDEVMIPRVRVAAVSRTEEVGRARHMMASRRMPILVVYDTTLDNPIGVLRACDVFEAPDDSTAGDHVRSVPIVPQTRELSRVLHELVEPMAGVALVMDEFGALAGLVVMEDVLEELLGVLPSGSDDWEWFRKEADGSLIVSAMMRVDDLNKALGSRLESRDYRTVGGLLLEATGRIPEQGEVIEKDGIRFTVLAALPNRLLSLRVETG
jgi:putative hemolysin